MGDNITQNIRRKPWIDILRAIAMLFVVFGHQVQWWDDFFLYTTPIKIPLFFAISGYLFNHRNGFQREFYVNCFWKLVFPFFCLVSIPAVILSFYYGVDFLFESWRKMISGESYWFITCLIVAEVIHFYIRKICKTTLFVTVVCLICSAIGLFAARNGILSFGKINTALISQTYLLLGFLLRQYEKELDRVSWGVAVGLFVVYVGLCFASQYLFTNTKFDCNLNYYYNIAYCALLIIMGCVSCFLLARKIPNYPKWLTFIGQNTFILYLWAGHALTFFVVLDKLGVELPQENISYSLVQTIWATVVCMGVAMVVNRYLPFIVGKK